MTLLLRNLTGDLVDRRLWPIAIALVAAIAAVPLVLGASARHAASPRKPAASPPAPRATSAPGAKALPEVRLDTSTPASVARDSAKVRNPFTSRSMPKASDATAATTTTASPAPASATPSSAASTQTASSGAPTVATSKPAPAPVAAPRTSVAHNSPVVHAAATKYRVAWRWGVEGSQAGNHDVARLTALPTPSAPALIYLGLLKRKASMVALFLVQPGAKLEGDGRCLPDPNACHVLKMRAHQSEVVTFGQVRYRLDVAHIQRGHTTAATAKRLRARESKAGRKALRAAIDAGVPGVGAYVFDAKKGLLAPYVAAAKG
jgi:hypothetical protein